MTHRRELLEKAIDITCNSRQAEYGTPKENLQNTANLWNAYLYARYSSLGCPTLTPEDVAWMNTLQKISRSTSGQAGDDTYTDAAAYAAIAGEIR